MKLLLKFDRIGRNHQVADLHVEEDTLDDVCRAVHRYARKMLASSELEVSVDLEARNGELIVGGLQSAGSFMIFSDLPAGVAGHPIAVGYAADAEVQFSNPDLPPDLQAGFVVGHCGHRVARSEWRVGLRTCERCPRAES